MRLLTPVRLVYCLTVLAYGLAMLFLTGQVYYGQTIKTLIAGIHWDIPRVDIPKLQLPAIDLGSAPKYEPTVMIGPAWQIAAIAAIPTATATPTRTATPSATPIPTRTSTPVQMLKPAYQGGPALSQLTALYPKEAHAWACANGPDYELWIYLTVRGDLLTCEQWALPHSQRAALPGSNP